MTKTMIETAYEYKGKLTSRKVAAEIIGLLAYHPTIGEAGFWTVTHVASGRALHRWIPSCKQAHDITLKLAGLKGWDQSTDQIMADLGLKTEASAVLLSHGLIGQKKVKS